MIAYFGSDKFIATKTVKGFWDGNNKPIRAKGREQPLESWQKLIIKSQPYIEKKNNYVFHLELDHFNGKL